MSAEALEQPGRAVTPGDEVRGESQHTAAIDGERRIALLRRRHRSVLWGVGAVILASLLLEVVDGDRVAIRGLSAYPLPHSCAARMFFENGCPACGLTRSFIHLAAGRWHESLAVHSIGWLLALAMLLQVPYRAAALLGKNPLPLGRRFPVVLGYMLAIVLFGNWFYSLLM